MTAAKRNDTIKIYETKGDIHMNMKTIWTLLFVLGLVMIVFCPSISRYISDVPQLVISGGILAVISGIGLIFEMYIKK